ncbi:MAG TPA: GNAT family N-acetyltransferase [Candidatus Nanopelagicales bacterium]|nr:GNAT family N-acetyltransferase [Candidatus Nanopelagicales bacterium]
MLIVRPASVAEVRGVQMQVLRPRGPLPGDRPFTADWRHLAALRNGEVIGACSLGPAPWPRADLAQPPPPQWQFRSLAVLPAHRGGVGSALVAAATGLATDEGVGSLWATARVAALSLYERQRWQVVGPEWDKPGVGPHKYVIRLIR